MSKVRTNIMMDVANKKWAVKRSRELVESKHIANGYNKNNLSGYLNYLIEKDKEGEIQP